MPTIEISDEAFEYLQGLAERQSAMMTAQLGEGFSTDAGEIADSLIKNAIPAAQWNAIVSVIHRRAEDADIPF